MKKYKFSLKDEAMIEEVGYHPNFFDIDKEEIPVPKEYLDQFEDERIYDENEFQTRKIFLVRGSQYKLEKTVITDALIDGDGRYYYLLAIPNSKQKVDDIDLRDKISDILFDSNGHCGGSANVFNYLQKHYTLTRK